MKTLENLIVESVTQEKSLNRRFFMYLAAVIVAHIITVYLFMSGLFIIPLLLAGAVCFIDLGLATGLIITMADSISEAQYQNTLLDKYIAETIKE